MAFNFNWSPLTADADFYRRARDLLTKALNKSPKPPIIVDDILVSEFNLGTVPPDLEILEIGDLAEDRFRGIFKMTYSGDAFLTLKTRVQVRLYGVLYLHSLFIRQYLVPHITCSLSIPFEASSSIAEHAFMPCIRISGAYPTDADHYPPTLKTSFTTTPTVPFKLLLTYCFVPLH
jgi:hypothetical protein